MSSLLNAAKYLAKEHGFAPIYLNEPMFPDPIVSAEQSSLFEALHILMCADLELDPAYVSVRRVVDWVGVPAQRSMAAHA